MGGASAPRCHEVVSEDGELADQAGAVAVGAGPLRADGGAVEWGVKVFLVQDTSDDEPAAEPVEPTTTDDPTRRTGGPASKSAGE